MSHSRRQHHYAAANWHFFCLLARTPPADSRLSACKRTKGARRVFKKYHRVYFEMFMAKTVAKIFNFNYLKLIFLILNVKLQMFCLILFDNFLIKSNNNLSYLHNVFKTKPKVGLL
jgi:hypothetical protein